MSRAPALCLRATGAATAVHRLPPAALAILVLLPIAAWQSVLRAATNMSADCAKYADPVALQQLVSKKTESYVLVDVRTPDEYTSGHIPTAINIPYDTIGQNPPSTDRNGLIIVYCSSGVRSRTAAQTLEGLGYLYVVDFGGIGRWKDAVDTTTMPGECPCGIK